MAHLNYPHNFNDFDLWGFFLDEFRLISRFVPISSFADFINNAESESELVITWLIHTAAKLLPFASGRGKNDKNEKMPVNEAKTKACAQKILNKPQETQRIFRRNSIQSGKYFAHR